MKYDLSETRDGFTGEEVVYVRVVCKCSHALTFLKNRPRTCKYCGALVYPTKRSEFEDKLKKEMRKKK